MMEYYSGGLAHYVLEIKDLPELKIIASYLYDDVMDLVLGHNDLNTTICMVTLTTHPYGVVSFEGLVCGPRIQLPSNVRSRLIDFVFSMAKKLSDLNLLPSTTG